MLLSLKPLKQGRQPLGCSGSSTLSSSFLDSGLPAFQEELVGCLPLFSSDLTLSLRSSGRQSKPRCLATPARNSLEGGAPGAMEACGTDRQPGMPRCSFIRAGPGASSVQGSEPSGCSVDSPQPCSPGPVPTATCPQDATVTARRGRRTRPAHGEDPSSHCQSSSLLCQ